MKTDYRAKVLKPLILKQTRSMFLRDDERAKLCDAVNGIMDGSMTYIIGDNFIVLGKSPKSQKKIRIAR